VEEIEAFFKITSLPDVGDSFLFESNRLEYSNTPISQAPVVLEQFLRAFEFLSNKSLSYMYQEVIEKVYIASKKLKVSITGHRIIHMFDPYVINV